ncbi:DUF1735 domain-containing protein [Mucilaginibacter endophyticus]|uniref:DUF1735 domain-containing protein n=1 Tax=Mucilaginibacter endophyticus TaxID=2675003 RepID=UPI000E0CD1AC|nr:DUF1735 domain-containing protein [Mucilaginibacter endophyticus]
MKIKYITKGLALLMLTVFFSSCLKDSRYVDFGASGTIVEFPLGGQINFGPDAITEAPDESDGSTIVRQFAVNVASPAIPTKETKITLAVDNSLVAAYNKTQTAVSYETFPTDAFKFTNTSVTIPAGQRVAIVSVTFYKAKLDPSKSYMLPIKIADAGGLNISANKGVHYYHFIGNDFAGLYKHQFTRTPAAGNFTYADGETSTFLPDSPTQFEVAGGYYTGDIRYVVSFTKTGTGASATYSHFELSINSDDVTRIGNAGITVTAAPKIVGYVEKEYTFAEALALFDTNGIVYSVLGGSGARTNLDQYKK